MDASVRKRTSASEAGDDRTRPYTHLQTEFFCLFLFSMQMPLQNLCSDVHFLRFRRDSQSTDSDLFLSSIPRFLCVFYDEE